MKHLKLTGKDSEVVETESEEFIDWNGKSRKDSWIFDLYLGEPVMEVQVLAALCHLVIIESSYVWRITTTSFFRRSKDPYFSKSHSVAFVNQLLKFAAELHIRFLYANLLYPSEPLSKGVSEAI